MLKMLKYLLLLIVSVWLGIKISQDPGHVLIQYNHLNIETTLWFLVLILFAIFTLIVFIANITKYMTQLFFCLKKSVKPNKLGRSHKFCIQGIHSLLGNNWPQAENAFVKAEKDNPNLLFSLASIWTSSKYDKDKMNAHLKEAYIQYGGDKNTIIITHAHILMQLGNFSDSLQKLKLLPLKEQDKPEALLVSLRCNMELGKWKELGNAVTKCKKIKTLNSEEINKFEKTYIIESLKDSDKKVAGKIWKNTSTNVKNNTEVSNKYIDRLLALGETKKAKAELEQFIPITNDILLINKYIEIDNDKTKILNNLIKWLEENPGNKNIIVCIARTYNAIGDKNKAREYYEKVVNSCGFTIKLELMEIYKSLNLSEQASQLYKKLLVNIPEDEK